MPLIQEGRNAIDSKMAVPQAGPVTISRIQTAMPARRSVPRV